MEPQMPSIKDYGVRDPTKAAGVELHPGDEIRLKPTSKHAHLAGSHRLGRVEKIGPDGRLLVRLAHASFWLSRSEIMRKGWADD
jgi:hypothetical protein